MMLTFASACVSGGGTDCAAFRPILVSDADISAVSDGLARDLVTHNETGRELCGW